MQSIIHFLKIFTRPIIQISPNTQQSYLWVYCMFINLSFNNLLPIKNLYFLQQIIPATNIHIQLFKHF